MPRETPIQVEGLCGVCMTASVAANWTEVARICHPMVSTQHSVIKGEWYCEFDLGLEMGVLGGVSKHVTHPFAKSAKGWGTRFLQGLAGAGVSPVMAITRFCARNRYRYS